MSIRKQAFGNKAFMELKDIYDNREKVAKQWKKEGKKVVGILGNDVPDELLMAAGLLPYRIYGDPELSIEETDTYLEFSFPPSVRSQFGKIISGQNKDIMDYLVISNSTDALVRIYFYIKEVQQLEPEKGIPEIHFIDWLFTKFRMHQVRNEEVILKFKEKVESWAGRKITDAEIKDAAKICNRNRVLLEEMSKLRTEGRVNGSESLVIIGAGLYMEKDKHSALVEELLIEAKMWETTNQTKLFVTGSAHEQTDFYEELEDLGATVVSEDHDWGDRHWNKQTDLTLEPIKGIVDRYMLRSAGTKRAFVSERVEGVCQAVKACKAQGFISYTHIYDDAPSWDFPEQEAALKKMGIPALQLSRQSYKLEKNEKIKEFINQVKEG